MGIIPDEKLLPSTTFIKSADFEGQGRVLQVKSFETYKPEDPKFGVKADSFLVKSGVLAEGEAFKFTFIDDFGDELVYNTSSSRFYNAFQKVNPDSGQSINIRREGDGTNTQYHITKV